MTTRTYIGAALANFKSVQITPGPNATSNALVVVGLGPYTVSNTGWDAGILAALWNNNPNPFFQEITASANGSTLVLTSNVLGSDFEVTCTVNGTAAGVVSTKMTVSLVASGGTFLLSDGTYTTAAITYSATPATLVASMQAAINALTGYSSGDVTVSSLGGGVYQLDFSLGRFAGTNVPVWTGDGTSLTGGNALASIVRQQAGNVGQDEMITISFPAYGSHTDIVNEVQTLQTNAIAGTFTLTLAGYGTTGALPYNAGRSQIQTALQNLPGVGLGNVVVAGGPLLWTDGIFRPVTISFQGALAGIDMPQLSVTVIGGGVNEVQSLAMTGSPTGGTFTLTFGGQTTAALPYTATVAAVQTALQGLSSIGSGNIALTGTPMTTVTTVPSQNEQQKIALTNAPTADGTFTLTFGGQTTSTLHLTDTAATISAALQALSSIGSGNITCLGNPLLQITTVGGANTVEQIIFNGSPLLGTFTLTFGGQTTSALPFTATAAQIQTALQALSSIGSGNALVTGGAATAIPVSSNAGQQIIQVDASASGTFTLSFGGQTTGALAYNASFTTVAAALAGLSSWPGGTTTSTGATLINAAPFYVTFTTAKPLITSNQQLTYISSVNVGTGNFDWVYPALNITFVSALGFATQPSITTANNFVGGSSPYVRVNYLQAGYPPTYSYTYNAITLNFQGTLAAAAQALITNTILTGTGTLAITELVHGAASYSTYVYGSMTATFQGTMANTSEALITSASSLTGGTSPHITIAELVPGGVPTYNIVTTQNGGLTTLQNITGGSFALNIYDPVLMQNFNVNNIPYNVTAAALQTQINGVLGAGAVTVTGGPAPAASLALHFTGPFQKRVLQENLVVALTGNFKSSTQLSTIRTAVPAALPTNVWDLTVVPGQGTLGVSSGDPITTLGYLILTINEPATQTYGTVSNNSVNIPLYNINPNRIQDSINEAFGKDVVRVCRVTHSLEHATIPAAPGYSGTVADLHFWYFKDVFRLVFINDYATVGTISGIEVTTPPTSNLISTPAGPAAWMTPITTPVGTDTADLYPEYERTYQGFTNYITNPGAAQFHQFTVVQNTDVINPALKYRLKLQTQYPPAQSDIPFRVGVAKDFEDNVVTLSWVTLNYSNDSETTTPETTIGSVSFNWDASAFQIQAALTTIFGTGNVVVTGSLYNSWLSESLLDAPTVNQSYGDLRIALIGQLAGLPLDVLGYTFVASISKTRNSSTQHVLTPAIWVEEHSKPTGSFFNQRMRFSLDNPAQVTSLLLTIDNSYVINNVTPQTTVAALQTMINNTIGYNSTAGLPVKWSQPVTLYGTDLTAPVEIEFSGAGFQGLPHTLTFGVFNDATLITLTRNQAGVGVASEIQNLTINGSPHGGTYTISGSGAIAYNAIASVIQTAISGPPPTVTGTYPQYFLTWPSSSGPQTLLTTTSSLNNSSLTMAGPGSSAPNTQIGGANASLSLTEVVQGTGPLYWDCAANYSPVGVPGSDETLIIDDATSAINFGLDQTSRFVVSVLAGGSRFRHVRNRQVFQTGQKVYLSGSGTPPAGLTFGNAYYIVGQLPDFTFQLSATLGGSPITCTNVGSGIFYLAVKNLTFQLYDRYSGGQIGLPNINSTTSLPEYLAKYLRLSGVQATIGLGVGNGISLLRLDCWNDAAAISIINSGQSSNSNIPAILLLANNAGTSINMQDGDLGLAFYSNESSLFGAITATGGTIHMNNVTASTLSSSATATVTESNCAIANTIALG